MTGQPRPVNPYAAPSAALEPGQGALGAPALWNPNAAANWCLLFSPIFGSYLHWKNWEALGEDRGRGWFIASLFALVAGLTVPGVMFLFLLVWYFGAAKPQITLVRERYGTAYPRRSWGKPLSIAFTIWLVIVTLSVFAGGLAARGG